MKGKSKIKRLYLDVCALCRPFDDQNIMRIRLETDAVYLILQNIKNGKYEMIISPVHMKEIEDINDLAERFELMSLMEKYGRSVSCDLKKARKRAEQLFALRFGIADAAHLAFAEETSDFFITCDDRLLKKAKMKTNIETLNPIEFCLNEDLK